MAGVCKIEIAETEDILKKLQEPAENWFGKRKITTVVLTKDQKSTNLDRSGFST